MGAGGDCFEDDRLIRHVLPDDHRSIVLVDPMGAMARLQLARALVLSGDTVKAKSVYNDLLTLWRNADPKIPMVNEARAEYARLP